MKLIHLLFAIDYCDSVQLSHILGQWMKKKEKKYSILSD